MPGPAALPRVIIAVLVGGLVALELWSMAASRARAGPADVPSSADALAITNVQLIPMTAQGGVRPGQTVLVRDGRLAAIGPSADLAIPPGTVRIDGRGRYLVPGLVDAHVHLQEDEAANRALLRLFVANGVTTVINLFGTPTHLRLRAEIARGRALGPTIFTSGPSVGDPVGQPTTTTPEAIAAAVAAQRRAGYDFIKLHGDLSSEAYHRLMAASRDAGIRVIGHAPRNLGVAPMIAERQPAIAHVEEYLYASLFYQRPHDLPLPGLDATIQTLAADTARAGSAVITTLDVYRGIPDQVADLDRVLARPDVACLPKSVGARWEWWPPGNTYVRRFGQETVGWFHETYGMLARLTLAFQRAHVPLLAGTDTPTATMVPGFSLHDELRDLVQAGLTPTEALMSATVNPARFVGYLPDGGTLEVGKRADAVLLDANPLDDITRTTRIDGVILHGRWLDRPALDRLLREVAPACRASVH